MNTLTKVERWDNRLKAIFDQIDDELESYVQTHAATSTIRHFFPPDAVTRYPLHPTRPPASTTANPEDDGHFDIGASFTAGIGSQLGPGYVLTARISTLETVSPDVRRALEDAVAARLRELLPLQFPDAPLSVTRDPSPDGPYKIHGDLSLS